MYVVHLGWFDLNEVLNSEYIKSGKFRLIRATSNFSIEDRLIIKCPFITKIGSMRVKQDIKVDTTSQVQVPKIQDKSRNKQLGWVDLKDQAGQTIQSPKQPK